MSSYFNHSLLEDLFAGVELKVLPIERKEALDGLCDEFSRLAAISLSRIAYDLSGEGWTARQIADEIGVGREHILGMIEAHATREGLPSPVRKRRSYENAVDISRLVSRQAREQAAAARPPSGTTSPTTA